MTNEADYQRAKRAKDLVREQLLACPWLAGIGIGITSDGYSIRLNVAPDADVSDKDLPKEVLGTPIEIVRMGAYKTR